MGSSDFIRGVYSCPASMSRFLLDNFRKTNYCLLAHSIWCLPALAEFAETTAFRAKVTKMREKGRDVSEI